MQLYLLFSFTVRCIGYFSELLPNVRLSTSSSFYAYNIFYPRTDFFADLDLILLLMPYMHRSTSSQTTTFRYPLPTSFDSSNATKCSYFLLTFNGWPICETCNNYISINIKPYWADFVAHWVQMHFEVMNSPSVDWWINYYLWNLGYEIIYGIWWCLLYIYGHGFYGMNEISSLDFFGVLWLGFAALDFLG